MTEEGLFQAKIKKWLDLHTIYHIKYNASALSRSGVPDRILCINGIFIGIEIKKNDKEEASLLQQYNIKEIKKQKGVAFVLRPHTFKKFKEITLEFITSKDLNKYKNQVEKYMEVK